MRLIAETLDLLHEKCFNMSKRNSAFQIHIFYEFVCMYEDLSDGAATPFEDRSFIFNL